MFRQLRWKVIRLLLDNLGDSRAFFYSVFVIGFIDGCLGFFGPLLLAEVTKAPLRLAVVKQTILFLAFIFFLSHCLQWVLRRYAESFGPEFASRFRQRYFSRMCELPLSKLNLHHSGYLLSIIGTVADGLGALAVEILWGVSRSISTLLLFFYFSAQQSPALAGVNSAILLSFILLSLFFSRGMVQLNATLNRSRSSLLASYADFASNVGTVKRLGIESFASKKIAAQAEQMISAVKSVQSLHAFRWFSLHSLFSLAMIVSIAYLLYEISDGRETPAILILFVAAFTTVRLNAERLSENLRAVMELDTYIDDLQKIVPAEPSARRPSFPTDWEKIECENVSFRYPGNEMQISIPRFELHRGETVGIVGPSGEGKTTTLHLLAALFSPATGSIRLDGRDYSEFDERSFNERILLLSQSAELFNLSVRDNILFERQASEEELLQRAAELGLGEWISKLEGGLHSLIGERGVTVSEGQKQRLNLLRAYFLPHEILLFDEPSAHLDEATEDKVKQFISVALAGRTKVIVSHRNALLGLCSRCFEIKDHCLRPA